MKLLTPKAAVRIQKKARDCQMILEELEERGYGPESLAEHTAVQINDTPPLHGDSGADPAAV